MSLQNFSQQHLYQRHATTFFPLQKAYLAATLYFSQQHMTLQKPIFLVVIIAVKSKKDCKKEQRNE